MTDIVRSFGAAVGLAALTACAHVPPVDRARLTPADARITDEAIFQDYDAFGALQDRVQALNARGVPLANYHLAKAQAFLDFAFDEYHENDRSSIVEAALGEADRLIHALESRDPNLSVATRALSPGDRLRPDLWALADTFKRHPQFRCATVQVARLEVALLHATHEYQDGGWRRARPHLESAEAFAARARAEIDACALDSARR